MWLSYKFYNHKIVTLFWISYTVTQRLKDYLKFHYWTTPLNIRLFHNYIRQYSDKIIRDRLLLQFFTGQISNTSVNESTFLLFNAIKPKVFFKNQSMNFRDGYLSCVFACSLYSFAIITVDNTATFLQTLDLLVFKPNYCPHNIWMWCQHHVQMINLQIW